MKFPKIKEVVKHVYLVTFDSSYDAAMTFLRYQEYYESPKFRKQFFTLSDYMAWYAEDTGNEVFTYPSDYAGFNLPSKIIKQVHAKLYTEKYDAITPYDVLMGDLYETILNKRDGYGFYLIGTSKANSKPSTVNHEIAHGMYTTDKEYKAVVDRMIRELPSGVRRRLYRALKERQYHKDVFVDEANAFLATGLHSSWKLRGFKSYRNKFEKVFNAFYEKNKVGR